MPSDFERLLGDVPATFPRPTDTATKAARRKLIPQSPKHGLRRIRGPGVLGKRLHPAGHPSLTTSRSPDEANSRSPDERTWSPTDVLERDSSGQASRRAL